MEQIKLVVTDLDGTLLSPESSISQEAIDVIQRLEEQGILFTFITGRPYTGVKRFMEHVTPTAPLINCNGAVVSEADNMIAHHSFDVLGLRTLMEKGVESGLTVLLLQDGVEYSLSKTNWVIKREKLGRVIPLKPLEEIQWDKEIAQKVNLLADGKTAEFEKLFDWIEEVNEHFSITKYGNTGCEIVAKGVTKATGLRDLCAYLNMDEKHVLAIGDNENDNELLKAAGIGAAVANATETAKKHADYICQKAYTDGFIEAVLKLALGEEI